MRSLSVVTAVLFLGACASPEPVAVQPEAPVIVSRPPPPERLKSQPLKYLVGHSLKPIPTRALDVHTRCNFRDVAGGQGKMDLQVSKAEVKRFVAEVNIPKQGLCRFDMKNFAQTEKLPNVVLTDGASGCVVRMWEQDKGVTVAFNGCQAQCSGDAFSYLWPILVDTKSGRCS